MIFEIICFQGDGKILISIFGKYLKLINKIERSGKFRLRRFRPQSDWGKRNCSRINLYFNGIYQKAMRLTQEGWTKR